MGKINLNKENMESEEKKKGLVICHSLYDLVNAYRVRQLIPAFFHLEIFIVPEEWKLLENEKVENCIGTLVSEKTVEETCYDCLFIPSVEETTSELYSYIYTNNQNVDVYLYDKGDIFTYCIDYKRTPPENRQNIRGIVTQRTEFNVWKYKRWDYHSVAEADISPVLDCIDFKIKDIQEKYIYLESRYFDERKYTNEMDILDEIAQKVGKENIIVKLYTKESFLRFAMRGYRTLYVTNDEWFAFCISPDISNHYLIGIYPDQIGYCLNNKCHFFGEIYLYRMLMGKIDFITSNSFHGFMERYKDYLEEIGTELYVPEDTDKLYMTLDYIEG